MNFELFVALRYLRARRKQALISLVTVISILGVAAGVIALNVALALNNGFREEFQTRILGATSHVNVVSRTDRAIVDYVPLSRELEMRPEIRSVLPTVYGQALLQGSRRQEAALLKGIDLNQAAGIADLLSHINLIEGGMDEFLRVGEPPPIILGRDLAASLAASPGERLRAVGTEGALSPLGRGPRVKTFRIAAIFESGLYEIDSRWALIPLEAAQSFLRMPANQVSAIEMRIYDLDAASEVADSLRTELGKEFSVNTWMDLNRPLFNALRLERLAMAIAIGLIVLVASLNIVSTLMLMVMEKSHDISILAAMGATSSTVTRIFMAQGIVIGVIGTILGDIVGTLAIWYLDAYQVIELDQQVYSIPYVPFRQDVWDLAIISLLAILISFVATLYPARSAARLDPVEGIRYE